MECSGVDLTKLFFFINKEFFRFLLLSLAVVQQAHFFHMLQTLKLNSVNQKTGKMKVWQDRLQILSLPLFHIKSLSLFHSLSLLLFPLSLLLSNVLFFLFLPVTSHSLFLLPLFFFRFPSVNDTHTFSFSFSFTYTSSLEVSSSLSPEVPRTRRNLLKREKMHEGESNWKRKVAFEKDTRRRERSRRESELKEK